MDARAGSSRPCPGVIDTIWSLLVGLVVDGADIQDRDGAPTVLGAPFPGFAISSLTAAMPDRTARRAGPIGDLAGDADIPLWAFAVASWCMVLAWRMKYDEFVLISAKPSTEPILR